MPRPFDKTVFHALSMMWPLACTSAPSARETPPNAAGHPSSHEVQGSATRGADVDAAPSRSSSGAAARTDPPGPHDAAFVLETRLRAGRVVGGQSIILDNLGTGATVQDGDRLQLSVRTADNSFLYLAFCSGHASDPRYPGLTVFPSQGGLPLTANVTTIVPGAHGAIVLDHEVGQETLYLILSRTELSQADSALASTIAAARQGPHSAECGAPLKAALIGPRKPNKAVPPVWRGQQGPPGRAAATNDEPEPRVEIHRGGDIVWNGGLQVGVAADPDGIVVQRYSLIHKAK